MQSPARRFYIGGAFIEYTDVAFRFAVQGNRKVDLEIASVVGQFVVVQSDTGDGLVAAQVIITFGALLKRNPHRRNTREINVNEGQCERNMPGIIAAAFISGNIDTDLTFVIESPFLVTFRFTADDTCQGAELFIVCFMQISGIWRYCPKCWYTLRKVSIYTFREPFCATQSLHSAMLTAPAPRLLPQRNLKH